MGKRIAVAVTVFVLAVAAGLAFLPLYDCALCKIYVKPRSQRRFCACTNGNVNLRQLLAGREEVSSFRAENECGTAPIVTNPRTIDKASWAAVRGLVRSDPTIFALEVVQVPNAEKYLPQVPLFQFWRRDQPGVWKLMGFDPTTRELFEIAAPERLDAFVATLGIDARNTVDYLIESLAHKPHQSLSLQDPPIQALVITDPYSGMTAMVKSDGRTVEARAADGSAPWEIDVIAKLGKPKVGPPVIRHLSLGSDGTLVASYGKHSFAGADLHAGLWTYLGSD